MKIKPMIYLHNDPLYFRNWKERSKRSIWRISVEHTSQILNNKVLLHILLLDNYLGRLQDQHQFHNVKRLYHNYCKKFSICNLSIFTYNPAELQHVPAGHPVFWQFPLPPPITWPVCPPTPPPQCSTEFPQKPNREQHDPAGHPVAWQFPLPPWPPCPPCPPPQYSAVVPQLLVKRKKGISFK